MSSNNEGKDNLLALDILLYLAGATRTSVNPSRYNGLTEREALAVKNFIEEGRSGPRLSHSGIGVRRRLLGSNIILDGRNAESLVDYGEVPSPEIVSSRLRSIGGHAGAMRLKYQLTEEGWSKKHAELGIQRSIDDGALELARDWSLNLPPA